MADSKLNSSFQSGKSFVISGGSKMVAQGYALCKGATRVAIGKRGSSAIGKRG